MSEKNLIFKDTLTVEQFKDKFKVSRVDVKKNPETGKLFFTFGAKTGAVASKGVPTHPMFSLVKGGPTPKNPTGEFWLLHEEGVGGAPIIDTF